MGGRLLGGTKAAVSRLLGAGKAAVAWFSGLTLGQQILVVVGIALLIWGLYRLWRWYQNRDTVPLSEWKWHAVRA